VVHADQGSVNLLTTKLLQAQRVRPQMVHEVQQEPIVALTTLPMQARRIMPPMVRVAREEHVPLTALLMQAW
jgi:hypothetical protein